MANKSLLKWARIGVGCLMSGFALSVSATTHLTKIQVMPFPSYARIIFNLSESDQYHVFTLTNPHRVVVDLEQGHLQTNLKQLNFEGSAIQNARSGHPKDGVLRIVFDMAKRSQVKSFMAADKSSHEAQLVVDIYPKDGISQKEASISSAPTENSFPVGAHRMTEAKVKVQPIETNKPQAHKIIVMIDAGHGGKDPGTVGVHGTEEKNVVLGIALRLADLINREPNMHAVLTRKGDYFVSLRERLNMTRRDRADLFVAIHADSYFTDQSTGASVYALSSHGASSVAARWLADRENHSELGGVDLNELSDKSYILRSVLIDLAQTATITDSIRLGTSVLDGLEHVTSLHYARVEQAPFMVLKSPDIPSILVETGFLSNPREEERLRDPAYRDKLARALLSGIRRYMANHSMVASNAKPEIVT